MAGAFAWGRAWVVTGEGFGALSAAVARIGLRRPRGAAPPGTAALMVVWLGGTGFDAFASTPVWVDLLGTSTGWTRTLLNTVGLTWVTAIVAGAYLLVVRVGEQGRGRHGSPSALAVPLGIALVPLATGWFIGHDLTLLLSEGQNFLALLSDPLGRGWDLIGTFNHTIDYSIVQAGLGAAWSSSSHSSSGTWPPSSCSTTPRSAWCAHERPCGRRGPWPGPRPLPSSRRPCWCSHDRTWDAGAVTVLAHQGGWDEVGFVLLPIALFALLLAVANRRATRAQAEEQPEPDDEE